VNPAEADFAVDEMPGARLHEVLHASRARGPITPARFMGLPAFVIAGYAELLEALRDNERFPPHRMYEVSFEPAVGRSFISMADLDEHRVYRKLATPAFRSRAVERYEREGLEALAHELIDGLEGKGEFDLVAEYTARFPYLVISRLLGLPRDRENDFHRWALGLLRFREEPEAAEVASVEFTRFLTPVIEDRRANPRDDVISELLAATVDGRSLSDNEIQSHIRLLFPTGGETTHGALGNLFYALFTQLEGGWQEICEQPARVPDAVEEALRWETPIAVLPRLSASKPVEFHGVEIPPDRWVLFAMAGANRDPALHDEPDRFDIDRSARDTLTFGRGVKSCPGMHLARRNMIVATQVLAERMPTLELRDSEDALPRRTVLRCPNALRVRRG
jgi:cytochrome P450